MDFDEFLTQKLDILKLNNKTERDTKAEFALSMAMDMADPPLPAGVDFLYRDDWLAFPPVRRQVLVTPVRFVRLTQSGGQCCENRVSCVARVKRMQETHVVTEGLEDISYNFLVDHEGRVFEGRGWHVKAERSPKCQYLQHNCVDICIIGNWKREPVPEPTMKAVGDLINYGVESNLIEQSYLLIGCKELHEIKEEMKRREKRKESRIRKNNRNKQTHTFDVE